jgi:hypothetical protein
VLLDKRPEARNRYAAAAVEYGWSRNVLMNKNLERMGAAPSNFKQQLVARDSEVAQQVAEDPYNFDFLGLSGEVADRSKGFSRGFREGRACTLFQRVWVSDTLVVSRARAGSGAGACPAP